MLRVPHTYTKKQWLECNYYHYKWNLVYYIENKFESFIKIF